MATFFLVLTAIATFHFLMESIIAPSVRLSVRFQLFALRDRVRALRMKCGDALDSETYHFLESSISRTIKHLSNINLTGMVEAHRFLENNPERRVEIEWIIRKLEDSSIDEVCTIMKEHSKLFGNAMAINASGWWIYIVPVLFVLAFVNKCRAIVQMLSFLREEEMDKFLPPARLGTI